MKGSQEPCLGDQAFQGSEADPAVPEGGAFYAAFGEISDRAALHFRWLLDQYRRLSTPWLPDFDLARTPDERADNGPPAPASLNPLVGLEAREVMNIAADLGKVGVSQPHVLTEQASRLVRELTLILCGRSQRAPSPRDKRFSHHRWQSDPLLRRQMQSYLAWCESVHALVERGEPNSHRREHLRFVASLLTSALAPSNALANNPAALEEAARTGGFSVIAGLLNRIEDLACNRGMPSLMNRTAFSVGGNLAVTPGAVVYKNPILELIQYAPATAKVYARPQLLVPPLISKGYVMDLAPGRSLIEYLLGQRLQVFAISWRNPTPAQRDWGVDDYVAALASAVEAAAAIAGSADLNLHGICGGTRITAPLLGHWAATGKRHVHASSLIVANLITDDHSAGLFASEEAIASVKRKSALRGVLDGEDIKHAYTLARSQDLVWKYWVSSYLLGNPPPANDILHWSCDTPRMPARLHHELLDIFAGNLFAQPGAVRVLGTPIDLSAVECDQYVVAGMTDHISPWASTYATARLFGGRFSFCANSSGHAQTIVSPPGGKSSLYHLARATPSDAEQWWAGARAFHGSWWTHWSRWLQKRSGALRPSPAVLGNAAYPPGTAAPGDYVAEP